MTESIKDSQIEDDVQTATKTKQAMSAQSRLILAIPVLALISGCASVLTGDSQSITIDVTCKGKTYPTYCTASNSRGIWRFDTPQSKNILRDSSPLDIVCESSIGTYGIRQYPVPNPVSAGNILIGGLVGTAVDVSQRTIWIYPSNISFESEFCKALVK